MKGVAATIATESLWCAALRLHHADRAAVALRYTRAPMSPAAMLLPCLLLAASCHTVEVTPAALREPGGRDAQRAEALARWNEAVDLMNRFLASPWRRTLPAGRFTLDDGGLTYLTEAGCAWPIAVLSTTWGDLVVATGFRAQEDAEGFVVGEVDAQADEAPDALLDNTYFRFTDGDWHGAHSLAEVTLHETTHVVFRHGTVGAWGTLAYYVAFLFSWSGVHHPSEDRPRATSEEYGWYRAALGSAEEDRDLIECVRDEHLAAQHEHCEHGPFPEPECP